MVSRPSTLPYDPGTASASNIELVGYHDLEKRSGMKLGLHVAGDRWYLFAGSLWNSGLSILDVTDPRAPELVRWIEGPPDTWTFQLQVADGMLIWGFERPFLPGWGRDSHKAATEGFAVYGLGDPENPELLGRWSTGTDRGTHRSFYDGGRYVHCAATAPGFDGYIYRVVDIGDPAEPVEAGRWWLPEQWLAGSHDTGGQVKGLHGPAYVEGERAFLSYTNRGMVILDVSDIRLPRLVSRLDIGPALGSKLGVHSAIPLPSRNLVIVNSEALEEGGAHHEPLNYTLIVDVADETAPRVISWLPVPEPPEGSSYASFHDKPGRFGPHNQHQWQHHPELLHREDRVYLTYFNAGLRVFDISDAYRPREIGFFVPPDPSERIGPKPTELVTQFEDVLVDRRGLIYVTDKNWGVHILRETTP